MLGAAANVDPCPRPCPANARHPMLAIWLQSNRRVLSSEAWGIHSGSRGERVEPSRRCPVRYDARVTLRTGLRWRPLLCWSF